MGKLSIFNLEYFFLLHIEFFECMDYVLIAYFGNSSLYYLGFLKQIKF